MTKIGDNRAVELGGCETGIVEVDKLGRRRVKAFERRSQNRGFTDADLARDDDEALAGGDAIKNRSDGMLVSRSQ
jgi:hypothetical protein